MPEQMQCPNCWQYQTDIVKRQPVVETATLPMSFRAWMVRTLAMIIVLGALGYLTSYALEKIGLSSSIPSWVAGTLILSLLIEIPRALKKARAGTLTLTTKLKAGTRYDLHCQLCDYRWTWNDQLPYPRVATDVDMVASERARLESQEAQRLSQVEAALYRSQEETRDEDGRP